MQQSSLWAQGLSCGFLLAMVILTGIACEWPKVRKWWDDVTGPLP